MKVGQFSFIVFIAMALQGCNQVIPAAPEINLATPVPVQKHSQYSSALENLGEMMEGLEDNQFAVEAEPIEDKTASGGKLPADVTMLVESALQNVGEKMLVMAYADDSEIKAAQLGLKLYGIHGAITEFDADTTTKGSGAQGGLFVKTLDISAEKSTDLNSGTIAMDFLVRDYQGGYYVPGVKATAKATIKKISKSQGYSFSIVGNGFGVNGNTSSQTPIHHVINIMVEYSMVQLIGKLKSYPYWLAINGADPDYRLIRKMSKKFEKLSPEIRNANISWILNRVNPSVAPGQINLDAGTKQVIRNYKKTFGLAPANDQVTTDFYIKLLTEAPVLVKQKRILGQADSMLDSVLQ